MTFHSSQTTWILNTITNFYQDSVQDCYNKHVNFSYVKETVLLCLYLVNFGINCLLRTDTCCKRFRSTLLWIFPNVHVVRMNDATNQTMQLPWRRILPQPSRFKSHNSLTRLFWYQLKFWLDTSPDIRSAFSSKLKQLAGVWKDQNWRNW